MHAATTVARDVPCDHRVADRRLVDRITVRALRAGLRQGTDTAPLVDDLMHLAGGDARLLARALHRIDSRVAPQSSSGAAARSAAILRHALDTAAPTLRAPRALSGVSDRA